MLVRYNADSLTGGTVRTAFYGIANYNLSPATYNAAVKINTPITSDSFGNLYFGFQVTGATPMNLVSGLARISNTGVGTWISAAAAANDANVVQIPHNCAPALSNDGSVVYFGARYSWSAGYLVGLNSTTLAPLYKVRLKDPQTTNDAQIYDDGTSCPAVGPDGEVYYGVLEDGLGSNHFRGWMLHFNSTLTQTLTPGAFGWDCTPAFVPKSAVPPYSGTSSYLLVQKYNNYAGVGGNGENKVAVLDPHASQPDPWNGTTVMKEILTKNGPTPDPPNIGPGSPNAVREWCINTCAVDPVTKCAIVNNEDGKCYRWDFTTNTLSEVVTLTAGIGEAYTPTIIGPDGKAYAINDAKLFAIGL